MFERPITNHYEDPVDLIWTRAANDLGLTIHRSADAFAAYDGKGTLGSFCCKFATAARCTSLARACTLAHKHPRLASTFVKNHYLFTPDGPPPKASSLLKLPTIRVRKG